MVTKRLQKWDYQYSLDSVEASVFEAWEFMIATYLHETKIEDVKLRRSMQAID